MLRQLVPMDLIKSFSPEDWKKVISSSYNRHTIRTQDDAKVGFLKYVGRWPTFGSAFFEVKVHNNAVTLWCILNPCLYVRYTLCTTITRIAEKF